MQESLARPRSVKLLDVRRSALHHGSRGDTDVLIRTAIVEQPVILLANHSFHKNHVWNLADSLPLALRQKNGSGSSRNDLCGIVAIEKHPSGRVNLAVVGAVVDQKDSLRGEKRRWPWLDYL